MGTIQYMTFAVFKGCYGEGTTRLFRKTRKFRRGAAGYSEKLVPNEIAGLLERLFFQYRPLESLFWAGRELLQ